ncbi:MAG: NAD-dependent epimerase/dehydratase family protein [Deltaproteobacteria bacterium]|nr:NAD-dependent epimerase/dehydratase family protein [Deltaproteobacteria bacterium]
MKFLPERIKPSPMVAGKNKQPGVLHPTAVKTIALTGTAGFLGSSILRELEKKNSKDLRLIAIDKKKPPFDTRKTKFYRLDLTETLADSKLLDILKAENVDTLIHTAFPITPTPKLGQAHELQSVGTMYLLDACAAAKVRKVVLASTTDVYGAHPTNPNFLSEEHPLRGGYRSQFIADKIDAEAQAIRFAKKYPETIITILRPCTIVGPTIHNFKTTFLQRPVVLTVMGYDPLFQFVHEKDVLRAFLMVIQKDYPGIFNVVGEGVLPLSKVLQLCGKIGIPVPSAALYPMAQAMWYLDFFPAPPSHIDFLKYLCIADGGKAKKVLNFAPQYSTREALADFIGAKRVEQIHLAEA